jgi:pimeloyl-ACP methyl ester carboxylesterase
MGRVTRPRPGRRRGAVAVVVAGSLLVGGCSLLDRGDPPQADPESSASAAGEPSAAPSTPEPGTFTTLADYESQKIAWGSCEDFDAPEGATTDGFECGYAFVPLDYDNLSAGTVALAVNRRPARGESQGAILVNPGGPGGSGVDYAFYDTFVVSPDVVEAYDLVGFDPRGVARSEGISCLSDTDLDEYLAADSTPDTRQEELEYSGLVAGLAEGCADNVPLGEFMDTQSVARDVDVLRAALGEDTLNWLGKSYGTDIGAVYATLFPQHVGRMVLDGSVDPDTSLSGPDALIDQITGFEVALQSFVADCLPRDDCPLSGTVDEGVDQVVTLVQRLDFAPLPTGDPDRPLTQGLAVYGLFAPLYERDAWSLLRTGLSEAFNGSAETLLLLTDFYADRNTDGTYRGNSVEALPAVSCLDRDPNAPPVDRDEVQKELEERAPVLGTLFDTRYDVCESWPFPARGSVRIEAAGAPKILVIGTTRDPATPYQWAIDMADRLDGVLLTFDGDGHTAYRTSGSECVDTIVDAFFLTGKLPADRTRCVADY